MRCQTTCPKKILCWIDMPNLALKSDPPSLPSSKAVILYSKGLFLVFVGRLSSLLGQLPRLHHVGPYNNTVWKQHVFQNQHDIVCRRCGAKQHGPNKCFFELICSILDSYKYVTSFFSMEHWLLHNMLVKLTCQILTHRRCVVTMLFGDHFVRLMLFKPMFYTNPYTSVRSTLAFWWANVKNSSSLSLHVAKR
jgi:hypothetical protein